MGWEDNVRDVGAREIKAHDAKTEQERKLANIVCEAGDFLNKCVTKIKDSGVYCNGGLSNDGRRYAITFSTHHSDSYISGFILIRVKNATVEVIYSNHGKTPKQFKTESLINTTTLEGILTYVTTPASRWDRFIERNNTGSSLSEWDD